MNGDPIRTTSALTRRTAVAGLGAIAAAVGLGRRLERAAAQEATPAPTAGHPIVGTWIVDRDPADQSDPPTMLVFAPDGSLIDPLMAVAGAWQATGPRSAVFTLFGLIDGGAGGYIVVRSAIEVDEAGTTIAGADTVTIVGTDGTVLNTVRGHGRATRLVVQGPEAAGTPLTGVPTWTPEPAATPSP
jgi:hypothetical protein